MKNIFITPKLAEDLTKLDQAYLTTDGKEVLNPQPMEISAGLRKPENLQATIQKLVRTALSRQVAEQGMETFDEADDFEVKDGFDIHFDSSYQEMDEEYIPPQPEPEKVEAADPNPKTEVQNEPTSDIHDPAASVQRGTAQDPREGSGQRKQD